MTTVKASIPAQPTSSLPNQDMLIETIWGVAIFDFSSLPKEYFITADNESTSWVQIVFQALGLKSLLMASLELDGFSHICIELDQQTAVLVKTQEAYIALLMSQPLTFATVQEADQFGQWVKEFEQRLLREHSRFIPA
ncbi:MAG: hypothetical protein AAFW95_08440 [Cyanobacteria bacterium J06638_6]